MDVEKQVVSIYAVTKGFLDDIAVSDIRRFEKELLSFMEGTKSSILDHIRQTKQLPDAKEFDDAINEFKKGFSPSV